MAVVNTEVVIVVSFAIRWISLSFQIWFQVKAANPHLSVCQIGATIGRMWRELSDAEKQRHLEEFQQDKVVRCRPVTSFSDSPLVDCLNC